MMTRFRVRNYKCLKDVDVPLTPIHVVIGANDAGKTSLHEAMRSLFLAAQVDDLTDAFPGNWKGRDLVWEKARDPDSNASDIEFEAEWQIQGKPSSYELVVTFYEEERKHSACCREIIKIDSEPSRLSELSGNYTNIRADWRHSRLGDDTRSEIARGLHGVHMYRFDPNEMKTPSALNSDRKFQLECNGFGLSTLLDDLLGYDPDLFASIRNEFCESFPQFRSVRIETVQAASRKHDKTGSYIQSLEQGKGITFETQHGTRLHASQVSDGAILFLGFLALTHLPDPPRLLLIEEPELGVYPQRLEDVIKLLRKLTTGNSQAPQIVMTTHSPYVLSFFEPEEVTLMSRVDESTVRARPLRDAPNIRERMGSQFYLGELWYNLTEEELFGDG
jgi:predicted ATPase